MYYYEVAPNQIIRANDISFTYASNCRLQIGQVVLIEISKKQMPGIILVETSKPTYSTKKILSIIEETPLPIPLIKLTKWLSQYYITPFAIVLQAILPSGIQKKRHKKTTTKQPNIRERTHFLLNNEQSAALAILNEHKNGTFLLQGVTGSGKTELYINIVRNTVSNGKSSIIIVPEIALTSQLISEFSNHFHNLIVTHSKMTEQARHLAWQKCLNSEDPIVVIGPRSALFSPLKNIGAIIIDEAHEPSLKQDQNPKYSALRAATMLGRFHDAIVLFGSATPSVNDRYLAEQSNKPILKLTKVARQGSLPPTIIIVDTKKRTNFKKHRFLSDQLLSQITDNIQKNQQTLIFHNRRGSTNITLCSNCGWTSGCPNCHLPLTLHSDQHQLRCHICGQKQSIPTSCPICADADIIHKGVGTKLIESEIKKIFPSANVARFDADNKTAESLDQRYAELYNGSIDIIIGTQIIAKGLDLPHLRTVGVIQADAGLAIPDYSSNERTFQLLSQVIGRVGRNEHQTEVIIQTYQPEHSSIKCGTTQDYETFYPLTLHERQIGNFPPFTHLLKLTCIYKSEASAIKNAKKIAAEIRTTAHADVRILGPAPAFHERLRDTYRWQLILKSPRRAHLIEIIKILPKNHWQFELDPTSLL